MGLHIRAVLWILPLVVVGGRRRGKRDLQGLARGIRYGLDATHTSNSPETVRVFQVLYRFLLKLG